MFPLLQMNGMGRLFNGIHPKILANSDGSLVIRLRLSILILAVSFDDQL